MSCRPMPVASFSKQEAAKQERAASETPPDRTLSASISAHIASLYSGHLSARRLAELGQVKGPTASLNQADRLFAGPPPSMPDYF